MAEPHSPVVYPPLPEDEIVYRALRGRWANENTAEVYPLAYMRRRQKDPDGLSVEIASSCTLENVGSGLLKCHGAISLRVGDIRKLGFDVIQDGPTHAVITGLPYEDEIPAAERASRLLVRISRLEWVRTKNGIKCFSR
jgi:hypothetical protein